MNNNLLDKNLIIIDSDLKDKPKVIKLILDNAYNNSLISDTEDIYESVMAREQELSTAIGYDIAIPHGKSKEVKKPFVAFWRSSSTLLWDENNEVKIAMLIGVPQDNVSNVHLKILSNLSKKLMNEEFRKKLYTSNDEEIFDLINSIKI